MQNINEEWVLQNTVSTYFEDNVGNPKHDNVERISYFKDKVEVVYKDGQSLVFSVIKLTQN